MDNIFDIIKNYKGNMTWRYIIIHHSLTRDRQVVDFEAIRRWHKGEIPGSPYKFEDIGYNAVIENVKGVLTIYNGRSLDIKGAHTRGRNHDAIGICLVGNYDIIEPTHDQYFILSSLCRYYKDKFDIPTRNILGHRSFSSKSCPGELFNIVRLRNYIKGDTKKYF